MPQRAERLRVEVAQTLELDYLLHLPATYGEDPEKSWPLILFLHGAGERGADIEMVKVHGIPKVAEREEGFPFIAVSPQCPPGMLWSSKLDELDALLDVICATYSVDERRIYVTGLSMGGYGTWEMATRWPHRFAAVAPICGAGGRLNLRGYPDKLKRITHLPVWVFHGAKDTVVPVEGSEQYVEYLRVHGSDACLTIYPEANHDSWTETYDNPELYEWFLSHSLP